MEAKSKIQYSCAVALILSSIVLAYVSDYIHSDIPAGTIMYIAQAFLLAGSIFGLETYLSKISKTINHNV